MNSTNQQYRNSRGNKQVSAQSSGLAAITFATLFDKDGIQVKCAASIVGGCRSTFLLADSTHCCFACGLSIHCALFCGAIFDEWYSEVIKSGMNPSMLPPHGQSKLLEYGSIPPPGQAICANCIESVEAKIGLKPSSMMTVSRSNSDDSAAKNNTIVCRPVAVHQGKQTHCAAGDKCRMGSAELSSDPKHQCLVCNRFMHRHIHMCGMFYSRWMHATTEAHGLDSAQVQSLIPLDGLQRIEESTGDVGICAKCIDAMKVKIPLLVRNGDDCNDEQRIDMQPASTSASGVSNHKPTSTPQEWASFIDSISSWRCIVVSVEPVNRAGRSLTEFTRLESITVGSMVVTPFEITPQQLRSAALKFEGLKTKKDNKKLTKLELCDALVAYRGEKEKSDADGFATNGVGSCEDTSDKTASSFSAGKGKKTTKKKLMINQPRLINVIFSVLFKDRFALRGQSLRKNELEDKMKVDQELWIDVVIAYLDVDNVVFGKFAFDDIEMHKDPSIFETDGIDADDWPKFQASFNTTMGSYEKAVQSSKLSGTHNDAVVDIKKFQLSNCDTGDLLYLHAYMQQNADMYSACCALLDEDVFCDSAGKNKARSNTGSRDRKKRGTRDSNKLVSALTARMQSGTETSRMEVSKLAVEGEREAAQLVGIYRKELDVAKQGKRRTRSELLEHFGGKVAFEENVALLKKKRDGSADGENIGFLSQESLLGDYIDYEKAVVDNTRLRDDAVKKLDKFSAVGKENRK